MWYEQTNKQITTFLRNFLLFLIPRQRLNITWYKTSCFEVQLNSFYFIRIEYKINYQKACNPLQYFPVLSGLCLGMWGDVACKNLKLTNAFIIFQTGVSQTFLQIAPFKEIKKTWRHSTRSLKTPKTSYSTKEYLVKVLKNYDVMALLWLLHCSCLPPLTPLLLVALWVYFMAPKRALAKLLETLF